MPDSNSILSHLQTLFHQVMEAVTNGNPNQWQQLGRNAKGDQVKWFDLAADAAVCAYLEEHFPCGVMLLSEEGAPRQFGPGKPEFTMVLDPVDGSENFVRHISPAGTAIALIPAHLPVNVANVQFALVGNLFSGSTWLAEQGKGAFFDGRPVLPAADVCLVNTVLTCNMNRVAVPPVLVDVLAQAHGARAFGAAALELALVAGGVLGAYIDLTATLTPENFLASALVITEAGGVITAPDGSPLPDIPSLTECYQILAAATPDLHDILVKKLQTGS